ncbi:rCG58527 [Rattus norvegicus]|uniref:RCG58527 n=1 Tax=Rattus norvegicus TaxID=10116 RepID=A6K6V0_RAT|nr:rCG58527 [Rattus norvegicus]
MIHYQPLACELFIVYTAGHSGDVFILAFLVFGCIFTNERFRKIFIYL